MAAIKDQIESYINAKVGAVKNAYSGGVNYLSSSARQNVINPYNQAINTVSNKVLQPFIGNSYAKMIGPTLEAGAVSFMSPEQKVKYNPLYLDKTSNLKSLKTIGQGTLNSGLQTVGLANPGMLATQAGLNTLFSGGVAAIQGNKNPLKAGLADTLANSGRITQTAGLVSMTNPLTSKLIDKVGFTGGAKLLGMGAGNMGESAILAALNDERYSPLSVQGAVDLVTPAVFDASAQVLGRVLGKSYKSLTKSEVKEVDTVINQINRVRQANGQYRKLNYNDLKNYWRSQQGGARIALEAPRGVVGENFTVSNLKRPLNRGQAKIAARQTLLQAEQSALDSRPVAGLLAGPQEALRLRAPAPDVIPTVDTLSGGLKSRNKLGQALQGIRTKFEDFTAPIEDALTDAEKQGKFKILPTQDVRYQIDKVLRADSLATQFAKDNGFVKVVQSVEDPKAFNQYLIAKQALDVSAKGKETGRNVVEDINLVKALAQKYEGSAQQIYQYNARLRNYMVDRGLISKDLAAALEREYPSYVPLKRVFDEVEQEAMKFRSGGGGPASIGSQSVVQRLKGSERDIVNPLESILENSAIAFREGERNKAAGMMVGYVKNGMLPGRILRPGETTVGKHTVSALINGEKVMVETTEGIADAAKNLNQEQLGNVLKIMRVPTRILQMGATGLNIPFVASNLVKDQVTSAVIGTKGVKTSLLNPLVFLKAFYSSVKQDKMFDDWVRSGSSYTSFDIARGQVVPTLNKIRAGRSAGSKILYTAARPAELLRAVENAIGITENLTRVQQYAGTKADLLGAGRTSADADILAGAASRVNTANFARRGEYGKVLNAVVPFFNAGIQGARSLRNAFSRDPKGTSFRFAAFVGTPITAVTLWNISDPKRREAYYDIQEDEKESNIVIIPPNPTQDENGRWNAIKIPLVPGLSNLASVIRRGIEGASGGNVQTAGQIFSDFFTAGTSISPPIDAESTRQFLSSVTPQIAKVPFEGSLNKNLFTGADIVPSYMKSFPKEMQVRDKTSGSARLLGKALDKSPLMVENAFSSGGAGVGRQLLNASDRVLNKLGVIPAEQVGGRSVAQDFNSRFASAAGGQQLSNMYDGKPYNQSPSSVSAQGTSNPPSDVDLKIIPNNGKFYVKNGGSVNSYDTMDEARLSVRRYQFDQSDKKILIDKDYVFTKTPSGSVTTRPRSEYDSDVTDARMINLKKSDNYEEWSKLAETKLNTLVQSYQETESPLDKIKLENEISSLLDSMEKYKGYKGFTKPKKAKLIKPKKVSFKKSAPMTLAKINIKPLGLSSNNTQQRFVAPKVSEATLEALRHPKV